MPLEDQAKVELAIRKGVYYLKNMQGPLGTWAPEEKATHPYGFAALPALTLLECRVSASNSVIQRAVSYLANTNEKVPFDRIQNTYEVALTILFLDRLGAFNESVLTRAVEEEKINQSIQLLAVRLMAAQKVSGGWGYSCPPLSLVKHQQLSAALAMDRPKLLRTKLAPWLLNVPVLYDPVDLMGKEGKPAKDAEMQAKAKEQKSSKDTKSKPDKNTPLVDVLEKDEKQATDNSCTQFALLAVWVAQKHKVPVDKSINLAVKRFHSSQNIDGGWGYKYKRGGGEPSTPSMICSGLVGFAVEHGVDDPATAARAAAAGKAVPDVAGLVGQPSLLTYYQAILALNKFDKADALVRKRVEAEHMRKALDALAVHVGQPAGRFENVPQGNLYFLWGLERVALLYNLPTVGGKDWYRWGAEQLIANQKEDGNWEKGGTGLESPIVDTCFALLFLSQANLAPDLAEKLKMDAQLAQKPADKKPVKNEQAPVAASKPTTPPPPPPSATKPVETPTVPERPSPETKPVTPASQPQAESAPMRPATPQPSSDAWILWLCVGGGVVLIGGITTLMVLGMKAKASTNTTAASDRASRKPVSRERDSKPGRPRSASKDAKIRRARKE